MTCNTTFYGELARLERERDAALKTCFHCVHLQEEAADDYDYVSARFICGKRNSLNDERLWHSVNGDIAETRKAFKMAETCPDFDYNL